MTAYCYTTTESALKPTDHEKLKLHINFVEEITKPLPLITRHITNKKLCPKDVYHTTEFSACHQLDVRQIFNLPLQSCLLETTVPILSLQMQNLCYLHEFNNSNFKPYQREQCDLFAQGLATHLKLNYIPIKKNDQHPHVLWTINSTLTWIELNNNNVLGREFLCLRNHYINILDRKANNIYIE